MGMIWKGTHVLIKGLIPENVCVCVCVCIYIYIYIYTFLKCQDSINYLFVLKLKNTDGMCNFSLHHGIIVCLCGCVSVLSVIRAELRNAFDSAVDMRMCDQHILKQHHFQ